MKRTTINLHTLVTANLSQARWVLAGQDRERGTVTVEQLVWAGVLLGLATLVGGLLTVWATSKMGELG